MIFVVFPREFQKARDTLSYLHWKNWVMVGEKVIAMKCSKSGNEVIYIILGIHSFVRFQ